MAGVGSFLKESRTLYVTDFKILQGTGDNNAEMYEILFRHFGLWGDIEDINLLQGKGIAFIRFAHRCMAEFAKEAMSNQPLDNNEILTIKWANDDPNPQASDRVALDNEKAVQNTVSRQKMAENSKNSAVDNFDAEEIEEEFALKQREIEKNREIMQSCQRMDEILKRIEKNNNKFEGNAQDDAGEEEKEREIAREKPEFNDQPLFFSSN